MAIKNIIAQGIGFSPGSTRFIPTLGFSISAAIFSITAPDATWDGNGSAPALLVKNVTSSINEFRVVGTLSQTFDDASFFPIAEAYGWALFVSDRTNWMVFAQSGETSEYFSTITSDTTLALGHDIVEADASVRSFTITLLSPALTINRRIDVKKIDDTTNTVTLKGTIDGASETILTDEDENISIASNGTVYRIL